jgi:hypothetical protein
MLRRRKNEERAERKGILGSGGGGEEGGHDSMSEPAQHRASRVGCSWFASSATAPNGPRNRGRDPGAENASLSRMCGRLSGGGVLRWV